MDVDIVSVADLRDAISHETFEDNDLMIRKSHFEVICSICESITSIDVTSGIFIIFCVI